MVIRREGMIWLFVLEQEPKMATFPSFDLMLLKVHQGFGCPTKFSTSQKRAFIDFRQPMDVYVEMKKKIFIEITHALGVEYLDTAEEVLNYLLDMENGYLRVVNNVWTFEADERQILWEVLAWEIVPYLARRVAFVSLGKVLDGGMPGGRFWYLPGVAPGKEEGPLELPVTQVLNWFMDLVGRPLEQVADDISRSSSDNDLGESFLRSFNNWRSGRSTPEISKIEQYFNDGVEIRFDNVFELRAGVDALAQYDDAVRYVNRRGLGERELVHEIPMTAEGRIGSVLNGSASDKEKKYFVECVERRYSKPSMKLVRQRLRMARMFQDGYVALLKYLCPGVSPVCLDYGKNKVMQLVDMYRTLANFTNEAWLKKRDEGEDAENAYFESSLRPHDRLGRYASIMVSLGPLGEKFTHQGLQERFKEMKPGDALEDQFALSFADEDDDSRSLKIAERDIRRLDAITGFAKSVSELQDEMRRGSAWRALQSVDKFDVIYSVAEALCDSLKVRKYALDRLHELAVTDDERTRLLVLELSYLLEGGEKKKSVEWRTRVEMLLAKVDSLSDPGIWKVLLLRLKGLHLVNCNKFDEALRCFKEAFTETGRAGYGSLRGQLARDCFAIQVSNAWLVENNHEIYYRELLRSGLYEKKLSASAGGVGFDPLKGGVPEIQDIARDVYEYFWKEMYRPYVGLHKKGGYGGSDKEFRKLFDAVTNNDESAMLEWYKRNPGKISERMRAVQGDTPLIGLIKTCFGRLEEDKLLDTYGRQLGGMRWLLKGMISFEANRWERLVVRLVGLCKVSDLIVTDFKGQNAFMLAVNANRIEIVKAMLEKGVDPDLKDYRGRAALHECIRMGLSDCARLLIDRGCSVSLTQDSDGLKPIHMAVVFGHADIAQMILSKDPRVIRDMDERRGWTPLEVVQCLLNNDDARRISEDRIRLGEHKPPSRDDLVAVYDVLKAAEKGRIG